MSKYDIDKFITYVEGSDDQVHEFVADPAAYVAAWLELGRSSRVPVPNGGHLAASEQQALVSIDYAELYRVGAHPYVLWHFTEAVLVWAGDLTWPELKELFREAITDYGRPDFAT